MSDPKFWFVGTEDFRISDPLMRVYFRSVSPDPWPSHHLANGQARSEPQLAAPSVLIDRFEKTAYMGVPKKK